MKKNIIFTLAFIVSFNAMAYDFSAVCGTGQTLYYTINSTANKTVAVVPQKTSMNANGTYYDIAPSGNMTIPGIVNYNNIDYTVISLGDYVFYGCLNLGGSLTIPGSVTMIGQYAFYTCFGLTGGLTIPGSVTTIGDFAFYRCFGFTGGLNIPNSVKSIGTEAFFNCNFTGSLTIPFSINSLGEGAFSNCSKITTFNVESGNKRYTSDNDIIYSYLKDTIIMCPSVKTGNLIIPVSVTTIGSGAFNNCNLLTGSLNLPSTVKSIGSSAFIYCSSLTGNLNIPNSVKSIGFEAFAGCSGFKGSLIIPDSITSIDFFTFMSCTGIGSLTISPSVTSIGNEAFMYCSGLTSIYANAITPAQLGINVFYNVDKTNCTLYVPVGSKSSYQAADQWKDFVNIVEMTTAAAPFINDANITFYPNPITTSFQITGIEGSSVVTFTDLNGKLVFTKQVNDNANISVSSIPHGVYAVRIYTKRGIIERKVVKE